MRSTIAEPGCKADRAPGFTADATSVRACVAIYEPHRFDHAHMRYSTGLAHALCQIASPALGIELLVSANNPGTAPSLPGLYISGAVEAPRPLWSYNHRLAGVLDRIVHWSRTDRQIAAWVKSRRDIVGFHYQSWNALSTLRAIRAFRKLGVRSLLTVHNVRPHDLRVPSWLADTLDRLLLPRFDALIVHSERLKRLLEGFLGDRRPPIYVVPHGVGETLRPGPLIPLADRMGRKQLLFVGAPRRNKGLPVLIDALALLPEFAVTLAGFQLPDRGQLGRLEEAIRAARRRGAQITVLRGFVSDDEMDRLLRASSAVMLPYLEDFKAQSGVLSLAITYGLPVVASDAGAVGETVRQFNIGCVVKPGSATDFAQGVRDLYGLPTDRLAANLSAAGRTLAWPLVARTTLAVYEEVCR